MILVFEVRNNPFFVPFWVRHALFNEEKQTYQLLLMIWIQPYSSGKENFDQMSQKNKYLKQMAP